MRIIKLAAENIKRIQAVEITPDGNVITIGGKNRAGKSSVLDAIAYALGGQDLIPEQPIRTGEVEAEVTVDLGDISVSRRFYRDVLVDKDTGTTVYGETKSTLRVKNRDGATYPSPQAMLDKLLGELTFDPREFAMTKPKAQLETLRKITNLDTSMLDEQRKEAFSARTAINRRVSTWKSKLDSLPPLVANVPLEELSLEELSGELARIEGLRTLASDAQVQLERAKGTLNALTADSNRAKEEVERLKAMLARAVESFAACEMKVLHQTQEVETLTKNASDRLASIPDVSNVQEQIKKIEGTNSAIRQNAIRLSVQAELERTVGEADDQTALLEELDKRKQALISAVKFPVEGLGFGEEGVLLNGLPFEQAATSEQLAVSVAIGLALNPKLRVLLVRNGESLDSDSMRLLGELAARHDAQLWVERMTETAEGVSVMIADGNVA